MTIWDFADSHWFVALIMFWSASNVIMFPLNIYIKVLRSRNIRMHGWPPAHLDVDGNWKPKEKK